MPEPIRVRIAEIVYESGCDNQDIVKARPRPDPYLVKDKVSISEEAVEKFRAHNSGNNQLVDAGKEQQKKSQQDPELEKNLETLDLGPGAKPEEIRRAYLDAVKKYHPDKFLNQTPDVAKAAEEKTKRINSAYSILRK